MTNTLSHPVLRPLTLNPDIVWVYRWHGVGLHLSDTVTVVTALGCCYEFNLSYYIVV